METTFIYVLKCPITGQIRYVGKSDDITKRLRTHLALRQKCHRFDWIQSLVKRGLKPVIEKIDEVPKEEWPSWEAAYIQFFLDEGCDLTNGTFGGDGSFQITELTRKKHRLSKLGPKNPMYGKQSWNSGKKLGKNPKHSARMLGPKNPNFGRLAEKHPLFGKIPWNKGVKATCEALKNQSESHKGKKLSLESIQKREATRKQNRQHERSYLYSYPFGHSPNIREENSFGRSLV